MVFSLEKRNVYSAIFNDIDNMKIKIPKIDFPRPSPDI